MSAGAFDRTPLGPDLDADLIGEGVLELAEELRAYAATAPAPRAGLTKRVLTAVDVELSERTSGISVHTPVPFISRLTLGMRPASFRSLLAAAALVAVLGAGFAFAAAGGLPFQMPQLWSPEQAPPVRSDTQQPADPEDTDVQGPADEDADASPDPSEDADEDQDEDDADEDQDEDNDQDSDEDADEDQDEDDDSGDEDADEDQDEDDDSGDEDADEDQDEDDDSGDEDSGDEDSGDEDSGEGQDESDDASDTDDQAPSHDSEES